MKTFKNNQHTLKEASLFSSVGIGETLLHQVYSHLEFTAIELIPKLACEYKVRFPTAQVEITDAYSFLYKNYHLFDIILASPPCQSYSKLSKMNNPDLQPDQRIKQMIDFLRENHDGIWIVENVDAPYLRTIPGYIKIGRHLFWSNVKLENTFSYPKKYFRFDKQTYAEQGLSATQTYVKNLQDWLGVKLSKNIYIRGNHDPGQIYREAVHPQLMLSIFQQLLEK